MLAIHLVRFKILFTNIFIIPKKTSFMSKTFHYVVMVTLHQQWVMRTTSDNCFKELILFQWLEQNSRSQVQYHQRCRLVSNAVCVCYTYVDLTFRKNVCKMFMFQFASRAKSITNKPKVNQIMTDQAMLKQYRSHIQKLELKLREVRCNTCLV